MKENSNYYNNANSCHTQPNPFHPALIISHRHQLQQPQAFKLLLNTVANAYISSAEYYNCGLINHATPPTSSGTHCIPNQIKTF
jgi:hypothetical protein